MSYLIACLSTGKGTWAQVYRLIEGEDWEKIIIVTNDFGKEKFNNEKGAELITINESLSTTLLKETLIAALKPKLESQRGFSDIAVSIASGTGKEHAALISALFSLGVGIRLIDWDDGMKTL